MILGYAWRTLRARRGSFVGAFLALLTAAALVVACGALLETGLRGTVHTERYSGTPILVGADQHVHQVTVTEKKGGTKEKTKSKPVAERAWLPPETVSTLADLPGAREVIGEVTFPAAVVDAQGRVVSGVDGRDSLGHAWESAPLTPFTLLQGEPPVSSDEVVIDRELARRQGLAPGDSVTVQSTGSPSSYRVVGIAAPQDGDLRQQSSLFFDRAEADRLAGRDGAVMAVGILPTEGADVDRLVADVYERLDGTGARVHVGEQRGAMEFLAADNARVSLISMGGAMSGTALLVAILVVVGTFALSVQQRHRELALLRAVAATPPQVRQLIAREALLVGLVAGPIGAAAGVPLARALHGQFVRLGAIPDNLELVLSPFPLMAAVVAAVLGSWVAARITVRRVARIRPAEALTEAAVEPRNVTWGRTMAGVVVAAGGFVLLAVLGSLHTEPASTPVTFLSVIVFAIAVSLLGPFLARAAVAVLGIPLRASRVGGQLAMANTRTTTKRAAAVVTPLALLIAMAGTVFAVQATMDSASESEVRAGSRADWLLSASGPGIPEAAAEQVRQVDGVAAVTEVVRTHVRVGLDKYPAQGLSTEGLTTTWDPDVVEGTLDGFGEGSVAISTLAASHHGIGPGDRLELTLGDGTEVALTVTAVYSRGLGFGDLTMSRDLVAQHMDNPLASSAFVAGDPAAGPDRESIAEVVAPYPGVRVLDRAEVGESRAEVQQSRAELNYLVMGLVIAFTAIAVVNTLVMTVSQRGREFALMRLIGATRRQVRSMLRFEALILVTVAALLGTAITYGVVTAFSIGMTGSAAAVLPLAPHLVVVGVGALLVMTANAASTWAALAARPAEVIGLRQ